VALCGLGGLDALKEHSAFMFKGKAWSPSPGLLKIRTPCAFEALGTRYPETHHHILDDLHSHDVISSLALRESHGIRINFIVLLGR
jgi:hypothetical protein